MLDEEADSQPPPELALLPSVLSFLSSFPQYLDIVVQCTRKTEVRSWRTLFSYLPPAREMFEESLQKGSLKTAGGYLLVLHTFEELSESGDQAVRLLQRAKAEQDWDLCKELARFLMALDESGDTLRRTLELVDLKSPNSEQPTSPLAFGSTATMRLGVPRRGRNGTANGMGVGVVDMGIDFSAPGGGERGSRGSRGSSRSPTSAGTGGGDYFGGASPQ